MTWNLHTNIKLKYNFHKTISLLLPGITLICYFLFPFPFKFSSIPIFKKFNLGGTH